MNSDKSTETKSWTYGPSLSDAPKHTVFGPRGEVIATVYHSKDRARLIAAAPELLYALRDLAGCCGHDDDRALMEAMRNTAAAIAKATGEHS